MLERKQISKFLEIFWFFQMNGKWSSIFYHFPEIPLTFCRIRLKRESRRIIFNKSQTINDKVHLEGPLISAARVVESKTKIIIVIGCLKHIKVWEVLSCRHKSLWTLFFLPVSFISDGLSTGTDIKKVQFHSHNSHECGNSLLAVSEVGCWHSLGRENWNTRRNKCSYLKCKLKSQVQLRNFSCYICWTCSVSYLQIINLVHLLASVKALIAQI